MHPPSSLSLILSPLLSTLAAAVLVVETSTSTYTAAAATSSTYSSSASPPTSSTASASPQYTSDTTFESSILNSTNTYRAEYNASALSWNTSLASYATSWASKCNFTHSRGPSGENLAEGYANVTDAVDAWGDEGRKYDFEKGGFGESTGHFSQLVWKSTASVGCGRVDCDGRGGVPGWFVVCEYWPAGNVLGQFGQEVGREVGELEAEGGGDAGGYMAHVVAKMSGGARNGRSGLGLWGVGLGMLVGLGVGM